MEKCCNAPAIPDHLVMRAKPDAHAKREFS
jgi:hypothetical protein